MSIFTYTRAHVWFAWYPVRLRDHRLVWLRRVRRRRCYVGTLGATGWWTYTDPREDTP